MIRFRQSIGFRLLIISFILLALPLLVDSFILVERRYARAILDAQTKLIEAGHLKGVSLKQLQPWNQTLTRLIIRYLNLEEAFPNTPSAQLEESLKKIAVIGNFSDVLILKKEGENYRLISSSHPEFLSREGSFFFKELHTLRKDSNNKGSAAYLYLKVSTFDPILMMVTPIVSEKTGEELGSLVVADDICSQLPSLLEGVEVGFSIRYALLHSSSVIFAATDPKLKFQYFFLTESEAKELLATDAPNAMQKLAPHPLFVKEVMHPPFFEFSWEGEPQVGFIKNLTSYPFSLLTYASKKEIFQVPLHTFISTYAVYGFILLFGGLTVTLLTMRMAKPMQKLGGVMQKIQRGENFTRYEEDLFGFEFNRLGGVFNTTMESVLVQKKRAEEERVKREILASELRIGRQVQMSLLPQSMPAYPGVALAEAYIPTLEVSGDFYDAFVRQDDQALVLAIADVSGKGVQACFYSLSVRNMLRTYIETYADLAAAMQATDSLFNLDSADTGMFVTVLCGLYHFRTKMLHYYSCGHNPGMIRRGDGTIELLEQTGIAMGVFESTGGKARQVQLKTGDTLLFYTDGVTEAHNEKEELFGEKRLMQALQELGGLPVQECVDGLIERVTLFSSEAPQHDDITLLAMKVK